MRRALVRWLALAGGVAAGTLVAAGGASAACPNEAFRTGAGSALPECRAYELVSPADKQGHDALVDTGRFRIAQFEAPGLPMAAGFASTGGFADTRGAGLAFDYLAQRTLQPGTQGWQTHALTPLQAPMTVLQLGAAYEPLHVGDADPTLDRLPFVARKPIGAAPNTSEVHNLYVREDARTPGEGAYRLLTGAFAPVAPLAVPNSNLVPRFAAATPDLSRVLFEWMYRLTPNAPASTSEPKLYLADADGSVRYVGVLPPAEGGGPAPRAIAGQGAGGNASRTLYAPHVMSRDGSRVFFTVAASDSENEGRLYLRDYQGTESAADDTTILVNRSERVLPDTVQPATYWDAAADGSRVVLMTREALTEDAPIGNVAKLYVYDASRPDSDPDNLTFISKDEELGDGPGKAALGAFAVSDDARTVYFINRGQLVPGEQLLDLTLGLYAWREDEGLSYVGQLLDGLADPRQLLSGPDHSVIQEPQLNAQATPDGRFLMLSVRWPLWPDGPEHGTCNDGGKVIDDKTGCRQIYLYDVESGERPVCVSCRPGGRAPSNPAYWGERTGAGAAQSSAHQNQAMLPDASWVYFTTGEDLLAQDLNGRKDVYGWERASGRLHLISSGRSTSDSYYLDARRDGHDVFFATRERLSSWDGDASMDVYDARVGGGVPGPVVAARCAGDGCRGDLAAPLARQLTGSSLLVVPGVRDGVKRRVRCGPGKVRRRVDGRVKCVRKAVTRKACVRRGKVRRRVGGRVRCVSRRRARALARARADRARDRSGKKGGAR